MSTMVSILWNDALKSAFAFATSKAKRLSRRVRSACASRLSAEEPLGGVAEILVLSGAERGSVDEA